VKLAISKRTGAKDAVKSISKAKLVCKEDVKDVQAEVAIMNLVAGHPHVVSLKVCMYACTYDLAGLSKPCVGSAQMTCNTCSEHRQGPHMILLPSHTFPQSTHEDKDSVHLAMELCAGGELFDSIVEAGNFSEKKAAKVRGELA